jgi:hypothetical protein
MAYLRPQGIGVIGKLDSTMAVSFKAERPMFRSRSVTDLRIRTRRGNIIKVMIGLVEPMGGARQSSAP